METRSSIPEHIPRSLVAEDRQDKGFRASYYGFLRQLGGVEAIENLSPSLLAAAGMSGNNKPCVAFRKDNK